MNTNVVVVDIEGTLSDSRERGLWTPDRAHEWHADFINDPPNLAVIALIDELYPTSWGIISAKPNEYLGDVMWWIRGHMESTPLFWYMRSAGDHRPSHVVKQDALFSLQEGRFNPVLALEDEDANIGMFHRNGIPTLKVGYPPTPQTRLL